MLDPVKLGTVKSLLNRCARALGGSFEESVDDPSGLQIETLRRGESKYKIKSIWSIHKMFLNKYIHGFLTSV